MNNGFSIAVSRLTAKSTRFSGSISPASEKFQAYLVVQHLAAKGKTDKCNFSDILPVISSELLDVIYGEMIAHSRHTYFRRAS